MESIPLPIVLGTGGADGGFLPECLRDVECLSLPSRDGGICPKGNHRCVIG